MVQNRRGKMGEEQNRKGEKTSSRLSVFVLSVKKSEQKEKETSSRLSVFVLLVRKTEQRGKENVVASHGFCVVGKKDRAERKRKRRHVSPFWCCW